MCNPTLAHELGNNPMERRPFVAEALLSRAQGTKVLSRFGHDIIKKLELDATSGLARNLHVEEDMWVGSGRQGGVEAS